MKPIVVITQEKFKDRFIYDSKKDLIGTGGFAKVYKAYDSTAKKYVALKIFTGDSSVRYNIIREINQVKNIPSHVNLIKIYQAIEVLSDGLDIDGNPVKYQVGIIEFANGGTLEEQMKSPIIDSLRKKILIDILSGLQHLHDNNIVHRDLKPNNILLHKIGDQVIAKIADFGIAKSISNTNTTESFTGIIGTFEYMSPEQIAPEQFGENGKINNKADLWSFGILVYNWVRGKSIYEISGSTTGNAKMIKSVLEGIPRKRYVGLSSTYKKVLDSCLIQNANRRVGDANTIIQILNSKQKEKNIDKKRIFKIALIFMTISIVSLLILGRGRINRYVRNHTPIISTVKKIKNKVTTVIKINPGKKNDNLKVKTNDNGANNNITTFKDERDGNIYKVVKIGNQEWLAENFRYNSSNSKCYPEKNCLIYGRIYPQKEAVNICPKGWHLPSNNEFDQLISELGGKARASKLLVTDEKVGFKALIGLGTEDAVFYSSGSNGNHDSFAPIADFWSSTRTNWEMKPPYHYFLMPHRKTIGCAVESGLSLKSIRYIKNLKDGNDSESPKK